MSDFELPNLMQVRAFVRVADLGSVSRASEALFRAQSVVTRAISELETRLDAPLFERHANGMRLTDYGDCVLPRARRVLAELESVPRLLGVAPVEPLYLFQGRRLEVFVKLCETRHMQTVASHFGLSQPAVSSALKVLEGGCGRPLFERTPRGLQPTRASHEILFPIRRALNELRHIETDLSAMRGSLQGVVHVGALPLGRTRILPEAIVRLTAEHPGVRVITNESPFDLLATELRAGDLDFVFGALRSADYSPRRWCCWRATATRCCSARCNWPNCSRRAGYCRAPAPRPVACWTPASPPRAWPRPGRWWKAATWRPFVVCCCARTCSRRCRRTSWNTRSPRASCAGCRCRCRRPPAPSA